MLTRRLKATGGVRFDYFDFNEEVDWSPRLALTYDLDELTSVNASWGLYHQSLAPSLLVQHADNRLLENPRADHYVIGLTRQVTPSTQLTLEAYRKDYTELPYDPDDPTISVIDAYADFGSPVPGRLIGGGEAESNGIEILVQKKLAQTLYCTASYAYSRSRYTDLGGTRRNRNFDNRQMVSFIIGYRPSDSWEYSVRWVYAGGRPRTPFDIETSTALNTGIVDPDRVNSERYEAYHRLDLRFDYRKHYTNYNLVTFFSLLKQLQSGQHLLILLGQSGSRSRPPESVDNLADRRVRAGVLSAAIPLRRLPLPDPTASTSAQTRRSRCRPSTRWRWGHRNRGECRRLSRPGGS